jgi:two-component system C4-dicarboxylate transport response regulator DctD
MPPMNGLGVLAALRRIEAEVPVIVLTGLDSPELRDRAIKAGAVAYLRKPTDIEALLATVSTAIARAKG